MNDCRAWRGRSYLVAAVVACLLPHAGGARDVGSAQDEAAAQDAGAAQGAGAGQGAGAARDAAPQELRSADAAGAGSEKSTVIYVVRRGWHIDVGFAAADIQAPLNSVAGEFPGVRYLFFGFGDRHYLLAKERNAPVSLGALWPGPGMILATALGSSPQDAFGAVHVVALAVTDEQMRNAQAFIWRSLGGQSKDGGQSNDRENGALQSYESYGPGPYEGSLYFAATPRYSAFHTCNTWAAQSLAAAALPIRSAGVFFAGQLWDQVRRLERKQAGGPNGTDRPHDNHQLHDNDQPVGADQGHGTDQLQGGLVPSWHTTVVPEF
jgi:hypothetical protein